MRSAGAGFVFYLLLICNVAHAESALIGKSIYFTVINQNFIIYIGKSGKIYAFNSRSSDAGVEYESGKWTQSDNKIQRYTISGNRLTVNVIANDGSSLHAYFLINKSSCSMRLQPSSNYKFLVAQGCTVKIGR